MGEGLACLTDPGRQTSHVITSMFLHGSWMHMLGNMWFLWIFGNNVEDAMGRLRFLVFYLLTGVAAALAQVVLTPASAVPMVGASGAISGVMGGYILLYPHVRVFVMVPLGFMLTSMAWPAWMMLGYWLLLQFVMGLDAPSAARAGGSPSGRTSADSWPGWCWSSSSRAGRTSPSTRRGTGARVASGFLGTSDRRPLTASPSLEIGPAIG